MTYAEDIREGADYNITVHFDPSAVADLIADVDALVAAINELLSNEPDAAGMM